MSLIDITKPVRTKSGAVVDDLRMMAGASIYPLKGTLDCQAEYWTLEGLFSGIAESSLNLENYEDEQIQDGQTVTNALGGKQSHVAARLDLIPPENQLLLGECLGFGAAKYGEDNWHQITAVENINHAMVHLTKWAAGDRTEPHLVNTLARVNFALWHAIQDGEQGTAYIHPDMEG